MTTAEQQVAWQGPEEWRELLLPVDAVKPHPRNPRRGDVALVAESLSAYGQTRPIVAWREPATGDALIVKGNHTWRAAQRLGWTHIAVLLDPGMSESDAMEFLIADNHTSDMATYDDPKLIEILQRRYDNGDLAGTGFTPDDLDDLMARANQIPETARQEFEGGYAESDEERDARAATAASHGEVKQLPLSYDPETHRRLTLELTVLAREWGTSGITETVVAAVERQHEELWQTT